MLPHRLLLNHSCILLSSPYAVNLELVIIYVFKEVTVIFLCLVQNVKQRLCLKYKQDSTPKSIYKKKSLINHHYEFRRIFESLSFFVFPFLVNESAVLSSIPMELQSPLACWFPSSNRLPVIKRTIGEFWFAL